MEKRRYLNFLRSYIKEETEFLMLGGFYPLEGSANKVSTYLTTILLTTFALLYNLLGIINAVCNISDTKKFSTIVLYLLKGVSYWCKIGNLLIFRKNLRSLNEMLQNPIIAQADTAEEEHILTDNLKSVRVLKVFYTAYVAISIFVQALYQFVNNSADGTGSKVWLPFNPLDHYIGVYCFEMLELFISSSFNAAANMLTAGIMDLCATQFILIRHRLESINSEEQTTRHVLQQLQKYIDHHNYVYRFSALIEETFSIGIFCQMACSVMVVIICVLKAVNMPIKNIESLIMAAYCLSMIFEIALYCWYGQRILNASNKIPEACYMSEWYNCDIEVQRYIVLVMNRGNMSVTMTAIGLFPLTLETITSICGSAYSLFVVLICLQQDIS